MFGGGLVLSQVFCQVYDIGFVLFKVIDFNFFYYYYRFYKIDEFFQFVVGVFVVKVYFFIYIDGFLVVKILFFCIISDFDRFKFYYYWYIFY